MDQGGNGSSPSCSGKNAAYVSKIMAAVVSTSIKLRNKCSRFVYLKRFAVLKWLSLRTVPECDMINAKIFVGYLDDACSGGIGQIDHAHLEKDDGEVAMLVVKIGGPAYRIGMGGGAASSVPSGSNRADLDFNAVQVY